MNEGTKTPPPGWPVIGGLTADEAAAAEGVDWRRALLAIANHNRRLARVLTGRHPETWGPGLAAAVTEHLVVLSWQLDASLKAAERDLGPVDAETAAWVARKDAERAERFRGLRGADPAAPAAEGEKHD